MEKRIESPYTATEMHLKEGLEKCKGCGNAFCGELAGVGLHRLVKG